MECELYALLNAKIEDLFFSQIYSKRWLYHNIDLYLCLLILINIQMASRRKLKKTIKFVTSELITDIYFRCLISKDIEDQKVDSLVVTIMALDKEYILRVNRIDGKDNPKLVKAFFRKLFSDWQIATENLIKEIEKL